MSASLLVKSNHENIAEQSFVDNCDEVKTKIADRLDDHVRILRAGVAFFNASDLVTREKWRIFTQTQLLEKQLPGIQGIGFSPMVRRAELPRHIQEMRRDSFPGYRVRPDGEREIYAPVTYLEPFSGRNLAALGYDVFSEPVRRAALEEARDTGSAALTGKIVLVQETDSDIQAGTLMYMPVYRKGMPVETVEQRRAAIYGWVSSPHRMNDLMQGILGNRNLEKEKRIHFQIFDGAQTSPQALLYENHPAEDQQLLHYLHFTRVTPVNFNGHQWTLRFTQTNSGLFRIEHQMVWLIIVGGILISLLLFALIRSLLNTRIVAQQMAEELTLGLQLSKEQMKMAQQIGHAGSWEYNPETGRVTGSAEWLHIFGFSPDAREISISDIEACIPEREHIHQAIVALISDGCEYDLEYEIDPADGAPTKVIHSIAMLERDGSGKPIKVMGFIQDITERKRADDTLKKSEAKFRSFFEYGLMGVAVTSPEKGWIDVNDHLCKLLGYTKEELATKTWAEMTHPEDLEHDMEQFQRLLAGEIDNYSLEKRFIKKNGEFIYSIMSATGIRNLDGMVDYLVAFIQDVTKLKQTEKEIDNHREHLEKLVEGRTAELKVRLSEIERMNKLFVDREFRIRELKEWVKELEASLSNRGNV